MHDRIDIRHLRCACIIGVHPAERRRRQPVIAHVTLHADLRAAGRRDRLEDTIDYSALRSEVLALMRASRYRLVEALAQAIATACLRRRRVRAVEVAVTKPRAVPPPAVVTVTMRRVRRRSASAST